MNFKNFKTKLLVVFGLVGFSLFYACTISNLKNSTSPELNFLTPADIEDGLKLKEKYANYSRIIENYTEMYTFSEASVNENNADGTKFYSSITVSNIAYPVKANLTEKQYNALKEFAGTLSGTVGQKKTKFAEKLNETLEDEADANSTSSDKSKKQKVENFVEANRSVFYEIQSTEDFLDDYQEVVGTTAFSKIKNVKANYGKGVFEPNVKAKENNSGFEFKSSGQLNYFNVNMPYTGVKAAVSYDVEYVNAIYNTVTYVPEEYFVKNKSICIEVPSWLDVEVVEMNMTNVKFTKSTTSTPIKTTTIEDYGKNTNGEASNGNTGSKYIIYEFKDIKPYFEYDKEEGSKGASYVYPHLVFLYKSAKIKGQTKSLTGTTAGLYDWYKRLMNTLENKEATAKSKAEELTKDLNTDEAKMKAIYYWIQDNIRYIAYEDGLAGFVPDNCANVLSKKYGDCKGMSNLMYVMLKSIGLDAHRTWIGTEHLNYDYIKTPGLQVDNHMITAVKHQGNWIFLDGTETMVPFGEVAYRIQNRQCLIENGDSFILARVQKNNYSNNKEILKSKLKLNGTIMEGSCKTLYSGQNRMEIIRSIQSVKSQNLENAVYDYISNSNSIVPSAISYSDFNNREQDFELKYSVIVKNKVIKGLNSKFLNLNWKKFSLKEKDSSRVSDLELGSMYTEKFETSLEIGANLKIKYKPADVLIDNEFYFLKCSYELKNGILMLSREVVVKQGYIPANEIRAFNKNAEMFNQFVNSYVEISE